MEPDSSGLAAGRGRVRLRGIAGMIDLDAGFCFYQYHVFLVFT